MYVFKSTITIELRKSAFLLINNKNKINILVKEKKKKQFNIIKKTNNLSYIVVL